MGRFMIFLSLFSIASMSPRDSLGQKLIAIPFGKQSKLICNDSLSYVFSLHSSAFSWAKKSERIRQRYLQQEGLSGL